MKLVSNNDDGTVIDFQAAKRQRKQTAEEKHREAIIGPCPELVGGGLDVLEQGRVCAEILPNGQARLSDICSEVFTCDEWCEIFLSYNRLVHAVCNSPGLRTLPNGAWVRVSVQICDRWEEHPCHPEYDEEIGPGSGMGRSFCDPREVLRTERSSPDDNDTAE
jgi:hypothetical protein